MQVQCGSRRHGVTAFYVMSCVVTGRLLNFRTRRDVMDASCMMALMYNEWCALSHISSGTSVTPRSWRELPAVVVILQLKCVSCCAVGCRWIKYQHGALVEWSWQQKTGVGLLWGSPFPSHWCVGQRLNPGVRFAVPATVIHLPWCIAVTVTAVFRGLTASIHVIRSSSNSFLRPVRLILCKFNAVSNARNCVQDGLGSEILSQSGVDTVQIGRHFRLLGVMCGLVMSVGTRRHMLQHRYL